MRLNRLMMGVMVSAATVGPVATAPGGRAPEWRLPALPMAEPVSATQQRLLVPAGHAIYLFTGRPVVRTWGSSLHRT